MRTKLFPAAAVALLTAAGLVAAHQTADAAPPITVVTSNFEDNTVQGWAPRAADLVTVTTAAAHGGTRALLSSGRTASWNGPTRDLLSTVQRGIRYTYVVWVRMATGSAQLRLSVERRWQGTPSYEQVVGDTSVSDGGWTQLTGTYTLANDADFFSVYVESVIKCTAMWTGRRRRRRKRCCRSSYRSGSSSRSPRWISASTPTMASRSRLRRRNG